MFVYTSELDAVTFLDVGPKRVPTAHYWDGEEKKLLAVQTDKVRGGEGRLCLCARGDSFQ